MQVKKYVTLDGKPTDDIVEVYGSSTIIVPTPPPEVHFFHSTPESRQEAYRQMIDFLASSKAWRERFQARREEIAEWWRIAPLPSYKRVPRGCRR